MSPDPSHEPIGDDKTRSTVGRKYARHCKQKSMIKVYASAKPKLSRE